MTKLNLLVLASFAMGCVRHQSSDLKSRSREQVKQPTESSIVDPGKIDPKLLIQFAHDLDSLFGDTINEGDQFAKVKTLNDGSPSINCSGLKDTSNGNQLWKCNINISVEYFGSDHDMKQDRKCEISWSQNLEQRPQRNFQMNNDDTQSCLEDLSDPGE